MGCGASSPIVIILDRTNPLFFSGEIISGTIQLNLMNDKLCADEIDLKLIGEIGYTTAKAPTDINDRLNQDEDHRVSFLETKYVVACPQAGEKKLTLTQGQYSWPFQCQLPNDLPPTMGLPKKYPHVRYYLQVVINKAWYKPNTRETRFITVFPCVNLLARPNCLMTGLFGNHNRKDIIFKGTLSKTGYIPGETIKITVEIENPHQVVIKQIDLSMIESYGIGCNSRDTKVVKLTVPGIIYRKDERIVQTFDAIIPLALPPSYHFQGGIKERAMVLVEYFWKFEVKIEGMFTNFDVIVPIIIGTK